MDVTKREESSGMVIRKNSSCDARILLVDDNPINQKVALKFLEKMGYAADVADNGRQAIGALEKTAYDIVLMDCMMPVLDGYSATRLIRSGETAALDPAIPIIAMTANAMQWDRERCIDSGMDDYLSKPFRMDDMKAVIEKWLAAAALTLPATSSTAEISAAKPFDRASFLEELDGDRELFDHLLEIYVADTGDQIAGMKTGLREKDHSSVRAYAHTLKGASGTIGEKVIRQLALELERAAKVPDLSDAPKIIEMIEKEFERFRAGL